METLLSDNWDNAYLNEALNESLMYLRRPVGHFNTEKEFEESQYFQNTFIVLIDHPQLAKFNSNVLIVDDNRDKQRDLIFILKNGLVKELEKQPLPDTSDVAKKITAYVKEICLDTMVNKYNKISVEDFTALLKCANLQNVVKTLNLEKTATTKNKM